MSHLTERTLVLNRSWTAITTTSVRHALVLAYRKVARIICPDTYQAYEFTDWAELSTERDGPAIRTPLLRIRVPEIIVLNRYNGYPRRGIAFSRRHIYRRDSYTCQYCGARPGTYPGSSSGSTTDRWMACWTGCGAPSRLPGMGLTSAISWSGHAASSICS